MAARQRRTISRPYQDMAGFDTGHAVVLRLDPGYRHDKRWVCLCNCGKTFFATGTNLRKGRHLSCGCLCRRERPLIPQEDGTALVPLTQGEFAIVDIADAGIVSPYPWTIARLAKGTHPYAMSWRCRKATGIGLMHVLIMRPGEGLVVDHIDGNGLNNRRSNMRVCTHQQNSFNKHRTWGRSKYRGVSSRTGRLPWQATITVNGRRIHLGSFMAEEEAAVAYDEAAKVHHGQYARLNFPGR